MAIRVIRVIRVKLNFLIKKVTLEYIDIYIYR